MTVEHQAERAPMIETATILVVDDQPDNLDLLCTLLKPHYRVRVATRGKQVAVRAAAAPPPDLILLDVNLPDIDGYTVCKGLKANPETAAIPVIFVTAQTTLEDEQRGYAAGAADYLTKPISGPRTLSRVRIHLALCSQQRHLESLVRERTDALMRARLSIIRRLGQAAKYRDNETGAHVMRMASSARLLALAIGMDLNFAEQLFHAAPMHDVGKIGIPDAILCKQGPLTPEEWEVMKTHPTIGAELLADEGGDPLLETARLVALSHHEHWDGSGYPQGLAGEAIPLVGRIVAIVDVFDALMSSRPYKSAWTPEQAEAHLRQGAGRQFDPRLVAAFLPLIPQILDAHQGLSD